MDGLEATRRLRQLPGLEAVPIIAVSASASGGTQESSLAAGVNAFLPKPISLEALLTHVASLLKITWTCEQEPSPVQEEAGPLVLPPEQEMETLHRLARVGNMQDILRRTTYLCELDERYRPFAHQLRTLASGYQSKALLSLIERHMPS
jgi:CheY-like chemotaxis protein